MSGVTGVHAEVEGLIGSTVVSNPLRGPVPFLEVVLVRTVCGLGNATLDDGVKSTAELHRDVGAFGVSGMVYKVPELVEVLLESPTALVVPGGLQFQHGSFTFPIRKEASPEFGCEGGPGLEVRILRTPEHHVRVLFSSILLEEGETPEDFGLLGRKVVWTELEVDGARVVECATILAVSVEDRGRGGLQTGTRGVFGSTRGVLGGFSAPWLGGRSRFRSDRTGC